MTSKGAFQPKALYDSMILCFCDPVLLFTKVLQAKIKCVTECTDSGEIAFQGLCKSKFDCKHAFQWLFLGFFVSLSEGHNLFCCTCNEFPNNVKKKLTMQVSVLLEKGLCSAL